MVSKSGIGQAKKRINECEKDKALAIGNNNNNRHKKREKLMTKE